MPFHSTHVVLNTLVFLCNLPTLSMCFPKSNDMNDGRHSTVIAGDATIDDLIWDWDLAMKCIFLLKRNLLEVA